MVTPHFLQLLVLFLHYHCLKMVTFTLLSWEFNSENPLYLWFIQNCDFKSSAQFPNRITIKGLDSDSPREVSQTYPTTISIPKSCGSPLIIINAWKPRLIQDTSCVSVSPDHVSYLLSCRITLLSRSLLPQILSMPLGGWLPFSSRLSVWKGDSIFLFHTLVPQ